MALNCFLIFLSALFAILRLRMPGSPLSWEDTYEASAHIWVGVLLTFAIVKNPRRRMALVLLLAITTIETIAFFAGRP